jgi:hypothetical protein
MRVGPSLYFDCVKKRLCKIPEHGNLLLGENSCAPLGELGLFDAFSAVSEGLVSEMSGGLISPLFEIEVVVVIGRAGLLVDGHWHTPGFRNSFKLTGFHTRMAGRYAFIEGLEN